MEIMFSYARGEGKSSIQGGSIFYRIDVADNMLI